MYLSRLLLRSRRDQNSVRYCVLFFLLLFLSACDFTSKIHKKILDAQNLLKDFRYAEAAEQYEKALDSIPPSLLKDKIYFQLGKIYHLHLNDNKKSIFYFEKIISEATDPAWKIQAKEKLAKIYFDHREFVKAEEHYRKLYNFFPKLENQDFYQLNLGISLLEQRKLREAENIFNQILKKKDHYFQNKSYYYLGLIKFNSQEWQNAVNYWLNYLKKETKKSELTETKFLLANAYETMEELQKAYDIYYSLLGEYPNSKVIKNRLESVYKRKIKRKR